MTTENPPPTTSVSVLLSAIAGRKAAQAISRRRMAILLATLILLILSKPIADVAIQARFVMTCATVGFLLSCLQLVAAYPRLRWASRLFVLLWLILNLQPVWSSEAVASAASVVLTLLILIVLCIMAQSIVNADRVDAELLCSAIGVYLLLGAFWAQTYVIISFFAPAAFAGPGGVSPNRSALLYFSFTTLTTTGFGDITVVNPIVRMWSIFEAIVGTIYNATAVARLVTLYGSPGRREDQ